MIYMTYDFVSLIGSSLGSDSYFHYIGISMEVATYILFITDSNT